MSSARDTKACRAGETAHPSALQLFRDNMAKAAKRKSTNKSIVPGNSVDSTKKSRARGFGCEENEKPIGPLITDTMFAMESLKGKPRIVDETTDQTGILRREDNAKDLTSTTISDHRSQMKRPGSLSTREARGRKGLSQDDHQMILDAGQQDVGEAYQCPLCMMVYVKSSPNDMALHERFHSQILNALKFPGWKKERVVEHGPYHRILCVEPLDPVHCLNKVQSLKVILDQELGYVHERSVLTPNRKVYLYIGNDKQVKGLCIAEYITHGSPYSNSSVTCARLPAQIGINRIWVYGESRRQGIATKLLDIIRYTFVIGVCVPLSRIAFSDSSTHGKGFAARYTKTEHFLIYKP